MCGSVKLSIFIVVFFVQWVADPGAAQPASLTNHSTNHWETTAPFFLDTDYRDYNITEGPAVGEPGESVKVLKHMTENLCIQTSTINGTETIPLFLTVNVVITGNDTVLKSPNISISIGANHSIVSPFHCNNCSGCKGMLTLKEETNDSLGEEDWRNFGSFCIDFGFGTLLLSLSFLVSVKIWQLLMDLIEAGSKYPRNVVVAEVRRGGYFMVPTTVGPTSFQRGFSVSDL